MGCFAKRNLNSLFYAALYLQCLLPIPGKFFINKRVELFLQKNLKKETITLMCQKRPHALKFRTITACCFPLHG